MYSIILAKLACKTQILLIPYMPSFLRNVIFADFTVRLATGNF